MPRRTFSALLAAILVLAPFPAWSQVGRVSIEAPVAPTPMLSAGAVTAAGLTPLAPASLTPSLALGLIPMLAAPAIPLKEAVLPPAIIVQGVRAAPPGMYVVPAKSVVRRAANDDSAAATVAEVLAEAARHAAAKPDELNRLYDAAPAAPDFAVLTPVKPIAAPAAWRPAPLLLKPAAAVVNAWRLSRHEKRLNNLGPSERLTSEERGIQQTLSESHDAISGGRLQNALDGLSKLFQGRDANSWYRANPGFQPYQQKGHEYIRFIERAVKLAYERAHRRSRDAAYVAEARAAARAGSLLGHEWRATAIQDRDSAHCAHHALFNAIQASVGFAYPLSVHRFIERAREMLNVRAESLTGETGAALAALQAQLGIKLGVDVGEGMGTNSITRWAQLLGLGVSERGPPHGDAEWSALLGRGREVLISLRMFHERFKHSPDEAALRGHDYEVLHHEVYLLGAFDSPTLGARLYMVQDSGSGATR